MFVRTLVLICFFLFSVTGCQLYTPASNEPKIIAANPQDLVRVDGLLAAINEYYSSERDHLWSRTYEFRTPAYRKLVPFSTYARDMEKGSDGWRLLEFTVISIQIDGDRAVSRIRFEESSTKHPTLRGRITMYEDTVWVRKDRRWLCVEPGKRGHLGLNENLSLE